MKWVVLQYPEQWYVFNLELQQYWFCFMQCVDQIKFQCIDTSRDHHMGMCSTHGKRLQERWLGQLKRQSVRCIATLNQLEERLPLLCVTCTSFCMQWHHKAKSGLVSFPGHPLNRKEGMVNGLGWKCSLWTVRYFWRFCHQWSLLLDLKSLNAWCSQLSTVNWNVASCEDGSHVVRISN